MMKMALNQGSMVINDNNETVVSKDIANKIQDGIVQIDDSCEQPELIIKDDKE